MIQPSQPVKRTARSRWLLIQLAVIFAAGLQLACSAQSAQQPLTGDEAINVLRARKDARAGVGYQILREFQSEEDGAKLAKLALKKARTAHTDLFLNGALVGLLRDGGYLVVEYDRMTDRALALHLVTHGEDGRKIIETEKIEGQMTVRDVKDVTERTELFLAQLLRSKSSELAALVNESFDEIPTFDESGEPTYFAIPRKLLAAGNPQEARELSAIRWGLEIRSYRYALSLPEYAASPWAALLAGSDQRDTQIHDFLATKGISKEHLYDVLAIGPINGPQQLKERLEWFRELDAYLDAHNEHEPPPWIVALNLSLAKIPLQLGAPEKHRGAGVFFSLTVSDLMPVWKRGRHGDLRLAILSAGGQ